MPQSNKRRNISAVLFLCITMALTLSALSCASSAVKDLNKALSRLSFGQGWSTAISADGSTLAIGDIDIQYNDRGKGSVRIYRNSKDGWIPASLLLTPDKHGADLFGYSVALSGDGSILAVGATYGMSDSGKQTGIVYLYTRPKEGWLEDSKIDPFLTLQPEGLETGAEFGASVAMNAAGDTVAVGAPNADGKSGALYSFFLVSSMVDDKTITISFGGMLSYPDKQQGDFFGSSVWFTPDGNFIAAGAPGAQGAIGSVYLFGRPAGGWVDTGSATMIRLHGSMFGFGPSALFGRALALSRNGQRCVVLAPGAADGMVLIDFDWEKESVVTNHRKMHLPGGYTSAFQAVISNDGSLWGGSVKKSDWMKDGAVILFRAGAENDPLVYEGTQGVDTSFGRGLALSVDGRKLVVGAPGAQEGKGQLFFTDIEREKSSISTAALFAEFPWAVGTSVAVSSDGSSAFIGGPAADPAVKGGGFVLVWEKGAGKSWERKGSLASDSKNGMRGERFGYSVAASSDGSVIVVGAPGEAVSGAPVEGAAYVFVRPAGGWSDGIPYAARLSLPQGKGPSGFGLSVAVNGDGSIILCGAPAEDGIGGAYFFIRQKEGWTSTASSNAIRFRPDSFSLIAGSRFGASVALDGTGLRAIIGAPGMGSGKAYIIRTTGSGWGGASTFAVNRIPEKERDDARSIGKTVTVNGNGTIFAIAMDMQAGNKPALIIATLDKDSIGHGDLGLPESSAEIDDIDDFGKSLAFTEDGKTLLLGSSLMKTSGGLIHTFNAQGPNLAGEITITLARQDAPSAFGASVDISRDGSTVLIGSPLESGGAGNFTFYSLADLGGKP